MERNQSIKNRLFQNLNNRSPKHPFLLQQSKNVLAPVLKPKHSQEGMTPKNARPLPIFKSGKLLLNPLPTPQVIRKKPQEVIQQKLSKEAKSIIQEGKNRLRTNLKPHDIFQLYQSFPEMMQDFFYLNRSSHPYDYQIVTYAQRNPLQYMTISSQGITLYHDKQAEFLTKQQWLTDEKRYYALQKIYFFKQYKLSKNFRIWKNKMKRHYMRQMSAILSERLFLTIKYPRNCLLQVKYFTNTLKDSLNFFPFDTMEKLSQEDFQSIMVDFRHKVLLKGIKEITKQITTSLQSAVAEEINKFKLQNNIKIDAVNQKQHNNKQGYIYSQEAILRKQYKRVYKLIKLADSMLQEAKIQMVMKCLQQLIEKIKQLQNQDKQPWITCVATIQEDGSISWQPNCQSLCNIFMKTIKNHIISISENNEKITNNPVFNKYRLADCGQTKCQQSRNNFKLMIEQSPNYFNLMSQIEQILSNQFKQTEKEQQSLQKFVQIYLRHKQLDSMSAIFKQNNGVQLCNYVEQWKKDEKQMHQLSQDKKGRLILYNYSDLRKKIINIPRQTLNCFLSLLPEETLTRCKQLITQSRTLFDMITIYPTEIVSFAKFNKAVKQASQRLEDIRSSGSQICLLIDLMTKNKMNNIEMYNSKKIEALNSINILKNKVDESQAKQNESLSKFKKDNEAEVIKIKALIKELAAKFNTIEFNQTKVTAKQMKDILSKIRQILPSINSLETQSIKIQQIEIDLNLTQTDFTEVHQLYENAKVVNEIWTCRDDWKAMLINLYHKHYCDVDCIELKQSWQEFSNKINGLTKLLPQNEILKNLAQQLGQVQVLIDTIIALRSPNLEQKAWRQISEYLAYELGLQNDSQLPFSNIKNPQYTVKWLLQINIPVYKQKIQFIVRKSQKEKELGVHLTQYKSYITNITFDLISKKREVYILADNLDIQQKLHLYLTQLYSMLDNQYSQSIKNQAQNLIRHYQYIQQIIKAAFQFSNIWNKYQSFFDSNSNSLKLLTKESKQFISWQTQWKKIIKNITTDSVLFYKKVCDETTGINCSRSMMKQISKINITIDQVKKGLDEYLEKKRTSFPRYYFIPDEQLLSMLATADTKQPITQSFVPILYKHIEKILYKEDTKDTLLGIVSKQGQEFTLKNISFKLQSQMQDIFKLTEQQIKKKIGNLIKNVFIKYIDEQITRQNMIMQNNTQVVLAIDAISWVRLAEETYLCNQPIGDLYDWIEIQQAQIKQLKNLLYNSPLKNYVKYKLIQVMSQSIYQRQKTQFLLHNSIFTTECYQWQSIPKLCMNGNNSQIYLKQLNNKLAYCYEFLGNKSVSFILPQTEKIWISIAQAINNKEVVCLDKFQKNQIETIRELGYVIAQDIETIHLSQNISFKSIQRFINGALFTGNWLCINQPANMQLLSFLAHQINHFRKSILDPNLQKSKAVFCNSNTAFFLSMVRTHCAIDHISPSLSHRNITLSTPTYSKIFGIISQCLCNSADIGLKVANICEIMKQTFEYSFVKDFNKQFYRQVLHKSIQMLPKYQWLKSLKCKQFYQFIICDALDILFAPLLKKEDLKAYETLKGCMIPQYQKIKLRHPNHKIQSNHSTGNFFDTNKLSFLKKTDYLEQFQLFEKAISSNNLGVILYGQSLSGKSSLLNLCAKKIQQGTNTRIKMHKVYHGAYSSQQIFSTNKIASIFSQIMNDSSNMNWIVFDGALSQNYLQIFGQQADKYLIPQIGTFIARNNQFKFKFICQTYDISNVSPSIIGNHALVYFADVLSTDIIVKKFFANLQSKKYLSNLHPQTIDWLIAGLINMLTKLQNKSLLKSKQISFIYPLSIWEITQRCCKIIQAIFIMNWQSMRQKQKHMKKMVDRFICWCAYWSLLGVLVVEDQAKLQKLINQIYKTDNYPEELSNAIIYPGCGFQVQQINGLRTQSSLQIPQKGIITNLLRSDLVSQADHQKGNKFYEEIVISEPNVIRVNYVQSNKFNYISQIAFLTDTPVLLLGSPNSGKKSMVQLFAKNMKNKSQYYSIRYKNRQDLCNQIQRPFRKLIGLQGTIMKSVCASKKLFISIQDVHLNLQNKQSSEFFRMIFNQKGYYNKQGQWIKYSNCSFNLIATKINTNVDHLRLISKMAVFQASNNMVDKLHSIFTPYLKNWAAFNGLSGDVQRIFNSQNGDTLLDATISIYKLMQQMHKNQSDKTSLQNLLCKPRIGDLTKVLTYICKTPQAKHYNLTYYYELWSHQIVRVFGDRLSTSKQRQMLFKQIKKQSLVKFKQNFTLNYNNMFNFTSLGIQNQNCYIRIEDPSFLHTYISNLLQNDQINLPLKFLFDELLQYLIKIYRVIAVQGGHLLLLCHNSATAKYLIQLACQVGQKDSFFLNGQGVSVQKHIEPALFYKDGICLTQDIDNLSRDTIYQIACLLNYNVYDFNMKNDIKDKVKLSLNKKQKVETEKKQTKLFSKTKTQMIKIQQKQQDIETLMAQQFMNYAHFIFHSHPTSKKLRQFISKQSDIIGQLYFSWIDIPQESILKVAKQILSFDQQTSQLVLQGYSHDRLIEKVRIISDINKQEDKYFNDILIISQLVKIQSARLSAPLLQRQKQIKQAKQTYIKVTNQIKDKENSMRCIQQEIQEINYQLQYKCKELQEINNKITQYQISMNNQENNSNQALSELRVQRQEFQIELKLIRERKEQLQPEKKRILKSIKIANDYLQIFDNSLEGFDKKTNQLEEQISLIQDKLIIAWSLASYLTKKPIKECLQKVNLWIQEIRSKLQTMNQSSLLAVIEEVSPAKFCRDELFSVGLRIKINLLIMLIYHYEQTALYGRIIRIYDPKGIFFSILQQMNTQQTMNYTLIKSFPSVNREVRNQIQTLCKMKNGVVVIEDTKNIQEIQQVLIDKKMASYLNKIVVMSNEESSNIILQCDEEQLQLCIQNLILKEVNAGMFQQKLLNSQDLLKELKRKSDNEGLFSRASANLNTQTETYTEQLNKYKNILSLLQKNIHNCKGKLSNKQYLELPEFQMNTFIYNSLLPFWNKKQVKIQHILHLYQQSIYLRNSAECQHLSIEEKGKILQQIADVNLGEGQQSLQLNVKFSKKWQNKMKLYLLTPSKKLLSQLQASKQYKTINLLTCNNMISQINQNSCVSKIFYNFLPHLHLSLLNQLIDIRVNDTNQNIIPLIIMADKELLHGVDNSKVGLIDVSINLQEQAQIVKQYSNKWIYNFRTYLLQLNKNKEHTQFVIEQINKQTESINNQQQIIKIIGGILPLMPISTISNLLNINTNQLTSYLCFTNSKRQTQFTKIEDITVIKQEVPFPFNISQFMPSKDPLSFDLISQCLQFNKKLKQLKDKMKEPQFQWQQIEKIVLSNKQIQSLNNQYQNLRKNLVKLHLISHNNGNINAKATSHKTFTSKNILFHNVLKLPKSMLNSKVINLMKCKAAKKFKNKLSNIHLIWKICTPTFVFQQNATLPELSIIVEGTLANCKFLPKNWNLGVQQVKKVELIAFMIESINEPKINSQCLYITIKNERETLGYLQVNKTQLNSDYIIGLESPQIYIEEPEL